jgi:predicted NBD/HSP70 family sugar kinase/transcriptional regulator with XRE-family HTH domain
MDSVEQRFSQEPLSLLAERVASDPVATEAYEDEARRLSLLRAMRHRREVTGLSQHALAKRMATTQSAVSDMEAGRVGSQLATLQRYARALSARLDVAIVDRTLPSYVEGTANGLWQLVERKSLGPLFTALVTEAGSGSRSLAELAQEHVRLPVEVVRPIVETLERRGWLNSKGTDESKSYEISHDKMAFVIGVSVHRNRVEGVLLNLQGEKRTHLSTPLTERSRTEVEAVVRATVDALYATRSGHDVLGVGIGLAGLIKADGRRRETGEIIAAPELQADKADGGSEWRGATLETDLQDYLQKSLNEELRVAVENDANCLAMAEFVERGDRAVISVLLTSTGVGAGYCLKGQVAYGANFAAGEIGHLVVDPASEIWCRSGFKHAGCLESLSSIQGVLHSLGLPTDGPDEIDASLIIADHRSRSGDEAVAEAFESAGRTLGGVLATAKALLDPDRMVIVGPQLLTGTHDSDSPSVRKAFRAGLMGALHEQISIEDKFGDANVEWKTLETQTIAIAAGRSALRHFLVDPWHWNPRILAEPAGAPPG